MRNLVLKKKKFMTKKKTRKSDYVCSKCGVDYLTQEQKDKARICTFFLGTCGLCNEHAAITHIRNYNYLHKKE
jgi:transcription initiation factor IIE alpha subunit